MKLTKILGLQLVNLGSCMCFIVGYILVGMLNSTTINSHHIPKPMPKPIINNRLHIPTRSKIVVTKRKYSKIYNKASLKTVEDKFSKKVSKSKPLNDIDLPTYLTTIGK